MITSLLANMTRLVSVIRSMRKNVRAERGGRLLRGSTVRSKVGGSRDGGD